MTLSTAKTLTHRQVVRLLGFAALAISMLALPAPASDSRRGAAGRRSDFGPSPDEYLATMDRASSPFDRSRDSIDLGISRSRNRDPVRKPVPFDWDDLLAPSRLPTDFRPKRSPVEPEPPTRSPAEATLDQKITQRYQDPRVIRVLTELTSQKGEAFFREVSQMIDARHIEPTSYAQRVDMGFEHLKVALSNAAFQQATGINPSPKQVRSLQGQLTALQRESRVRNQADAIGVMRQVSQLLQPSVGLNPGAVSFEFVYASLDTLDKFSMLLPPEKTGQVNLGVNDHLVGIGVEVEADRAGLKILKAIPGGPAAEATLRKGDMITAVNGKSLRGMDLSRAVELITGPAGTPVKLSLQRGNLVADVTLIRQAVALRSVSEVRMLDESSRVGYVKLDQFGESSARELDEALWKLHQSGMESLVLDLRGNPGGYLTSAIEVSDRFLPSGTIVSTRGRTPDDNSKETATFAQTWKTPLVVLIDHGSASASEIFAAAIQENGRGLIVGEKSYGKGTVQTLFPLQSLTAGLRLTTAKFYSPDGREMAGVGVTPDIKVRTGSSDDDAAMLEAAAEAARDPRLQAMANQLGRPGRTGLRVIQVAATLGE
jgi:carboxyl-terminal processing protease